MLCRNPDAPLLERPSVWSFPTVVDALEVEADHRDSHEPNFDKDAWKEQQHRALYGTKEVWDLHEEERVAFEATTLLTDTTNNREVPRVLVQSFSLLVPYTNYPPAQEYRMHIRPPFDSMGGRSIVNTESIYEYFAEIKWSNGTRQEVLAVFTSFAPFDQSEVPETDSFTIPLDVSQLPEKGGADYDSLKSNYSIIECGSDSSHVGSGSLLNLTIMVFRSGYTNKTDTPLSVCISYDNEVHPSMMKPGFSYEKIRYFHRRFSATPRPPYQQPLMLNPCPKVEFPSKNSGVDEGVLEVTASSPLSAPLLYHGPIVGFSSYYAKPRGRVSVALSVQRDERELLNVYDRGIMAPAPRTRRDEEDSDCFSYTDPRPPQIARGFEGNISLSVPSRRADPSRQPPVHYLSPAGDIKAPIFVDPRTVEKLRKLSPEERDAMAPIAHPWVSVTPEGEETVAERYFPWRDSGSLLYVGETWANKVLPKLQNKSQGVNGQSSHGGRPDTRLLVQGM
ncbi:hypothetical protein BDN67DRAFT_1072354 [Paxillus ammoniavirescens]|nr:hypothetical protein BDN67DRAFT_1072354 [Paxillus ammoniavirescens]